MSVLVSCSLVAFFAGFQVVAGPLYDLYGIRPDFTILALVTACLVLPPGATYAAALLAGGVLDALSPGIVGPYMTGCLLSTFFLLRCRSAGLAESARGTALLAIAGHDPEAHPELDTREKVVGFLREGESVLANLSRATQDGVVRTVLDTNRLVRGHHHRAFGGTLTHIRADADHADRPQLRADLWTPHCAVLDAVGVPFLHRELPGKPASALIGPILSERMAAAERISA